jgi:nitrate reductase alpha subunit
MVTGQPAVPGGSLGFRFGEAGLGRWNLDLGDIVPVLTLQAPEAERVAVDLPRFDADDGTAGTLRRGVPARRIAGRLVTTVFDLLLAQYGVGRGGRRHPRASWTCCWRWISG